LDQFAAENQVEAFSVEMPRRITPVKDLQVVLQLWKRFRQVRPTVVHAHTPKGGLLGMIAAYLARVPVRIYHIRGLPLMTATGRRRTLLIWTERISCRLAHRVLAVSHSMREVAIAERICPADKIVTPLGGSGNGVDAAGRFHPARSGRQSGNAVRAQYGIPDDAVVLGFVGRLVRDKGVSELAAAWEKLSRQFPQLHLLVVGHFEPQDPVPEVVQETLHTDPRIHLAGTNWDTPPFYAAMDVVVLPTYREGFPNVPLEAAAMERPVVATRIPGCVDAVQDGVTGLLVPPRDVDALAEAIARYVRDAELRAKHGAAGRRRVLRDFRPEGIWNEVWREYCLLLRRVGLRVPQTDPLADIPPRRAA
jgi:glycosyltransferase involved in cell wall biosynthesis